MFLVFLIVILSMILYCHCVDGEAGTIQMTGMMQIQMVTAVGRDHQHQVRPSLPPVSLVVFSWSLFAAFTVESCCCCCSRPVFAFGFIFFGKAAMKKKDRHVYIIVEYCRTLCSADSRVKNKIDLFKRVIIRY